MCTVSLSHFPSRLFFCVYVLSAHRDGDHKKVLCGNNARHNVMMVARVDTRYNSD